MPPEIAKLLLDMRNAGERIQRFTLRKSLEDFINDDLLRSAVERQFEIIGEAMSRLRQAAPDVANTLTDSRKIAGFRNALIHGYDSINDQISWDIVTSKLPVLLAEVVMLLN